MPSPRAADSRPGTRVCMTRGGKHEKKASQPASRHNDSTTVL